jgi:hypothetical protein
MLEINMKETNNVLRRYFVGMQRVRKKITKSLCIITIHLLNLSLQLRATTHATQKRQSSYEVPAIASKMETDKEMA